MELVKHLKHFSFALIHLLAHFFFFAALLVLQFTNVFLKLLRGFVNVIDLDSKLGCESTRIKIS